MLDSRRFPRSLPLAAMLVLLLAACGGNDLSPDTAPAKDGGPTDATVACEDELQGPDDDILEIEGVRTKIEEGLAYTCSGGQWTYLKDMRGPFFDKFILEKTATGCNVTIKETGETHALVQKFSDDFEDAASFGDLFSTDRWDHILLQEPNAYTTEETNALAASILAGGPFGENTIEVVTDRAHSGQRSLKFSAVAPSAEMLALPSITPTKAQIEKRNLCFTKGDDLWYSAYYYAAVGMPSTLGDFETMEILFSPGPRIFIAGNTYPIVELKFADKPTYTQREVAFPRGRWVKLKLHLHLSNGHDGVIELWQDDQPIIATKGRTLPLHDTLLHRLSVGITATDAATVLYVDDVKISNAPL